MNEAKLLVRHTDAAYKSEKRLVVPLLGFPGLNLTGSTIKLAQQNYGEHFKVLKKLSTTANNLTVGIEGETFEIEEMYPAYMAVAELQEERGAVRSTKWAREAEKIHAEMYTQAKDAVDGGSDAEIGKMHVCSVCGWTGEGDAPDNCPLCNAKKHLFTMFD